MSKDDLGEFILCLKVKENIAIERENVKDF